VVWTTEYDGLAVESMRAAGRRVDDEVLAHISPAHSENINFFGAIDLDIDGELAQLDSAGYRPRAGPTPDHIEPRWMAGRGRRWSRTAAPRRTPTATVRIDVARCPGTRRSGSTM
jgi:hypothetical protein